MNCVNYPTECNSSRAGNMGTRLVSSASSLPRIVTVAPVGWQGEGDG